MSRDIEPLSPSLCVRVGVWLGGVCVCVCVCMLSRVWLFATPWTVAHQAPLSMLFSRQEYFSRRPFPSPRDLPDPGIETLSLGRWILYLCATWEAPNLIATCKAISLKIWEVYSFLGGWGGITPISKDKWPPQLLGESRISCMWQMELSRRLTWD